MAKAKKNKSMKRLRRTAKKSGAWKSVGTIVLGALGGHMATTYIANKLKERQADSKLMPLISPIAVIFGSKYGIKNDLLQKSIMAGAIPTSIELILDAGVVGTVDKTKKTALNQALFLAGDSEDPLAGDYVVAGEEGFLYGEEEEEVQGEYVVSGDYDSDPLQ